MMEHTYTYKKRNLGWLVVVLGAPLFWYCQPAPKIDQPSTPTSGGIDGSSANSAARIAELEKRLAAAQAGSSCAPTDGDSLQKKLEATSADLEAVKAEKQGLASKWAGLTRVGRRLCTPPEGPPPGGGRRRRPPEVPLHSEGAPPPDPEKEPPTEEEPKQPVVDVAGLRNRLSALQVKCRELPNRKQGIPVEKASIDEVIRQLRASNGTMTCKMSSEQAGNKCQLVSVPTLQSRDAVQQNVPGATQRAIKALEKRKASLERHLKNLEKDCTTLVAELQRQIQAAESTNTSSTP